MAAKNGNKGRGAKAPRSRPRTKGANAKARALHKGLIKAAGKPAMKKPPTVAADAKRPKTVRAPKKRFKADGLLKRQDGTPNTFDHTRAVHAVLVEAWTNKLMMSSDRSRALSTALGIAFSCGLVTTLCGHTFCRQVLVTKKGLDFLEASFGPSAGRALYTKRKRAMHGGDVAGVVEEHQPTLH